MSVIDRFVPRYGWIVPTNKVHIDSANAIVRVDLLLQVGRLIGEFRKTLGLEMRKTGRVILHYGAASDSTVVQRRTPIGVVVLDRNTIHAYSVVLIVRNGCEIGPRYQQRVRSTIPIGSEARESLPTHVVARVIGYLPRPFMVYTKRERAALGPGVFFATRVIYLIPTNGTYEEHE